MNNNDVINAIMESDIPPRGDKCVTPDCPNHQNEGRFVGNRCSPCYDYIERNIIGYPLVADGSEDIGLAPGEQGGPDHA